MRLGTVSTAGGPRAVRLDPDGYRLLPYADVGALLADPGGMETARLAVGPVIVEPTLLTPVLSPAKVICVGLNYKRHIEETGEATPEYPTLFSKFSDSLLGPADDLVIPAHSTRVDWEAELVAVIGGVIRDGDVRQAEHAIAGFTVGNDISMRDHQARTSQWLQGKAWDASAPLGPVMLTADECGPRPDLAIGCSVNGVMKQESRTSDLLFGVPELVSYISRFTTLNPGDVVFTGTPGGVGQARPTPEFLHPGDTLVTWVEGIGELRNLCVVPTGPTA